jgi:hypothetical protein
MVASETKTEAWESAVNRTVHRRIVLSVLACVVATTSVSVADAGVAKVGKQIRIAKLSSATQKRLRRVGVSGPALTLLGSPNLDGSKLAGMALYSAPWSKGGLCVSAVTAGVPDGADCDPKLFTAREPGYASAGPFGVTIPAASSTTTGTTPSLPAHTLSLLQVYGAATSTVKSARLIGPKSGTTKLPLSAGGPGFVVFGSGSPPPDGDFVELRDGSGKLLQRIQIAP